MTPAEFKAWLAGYSEAIKDAPTPESPSLKLASKINASQCSALLIVG